MKLLIKSSLFLLLFTWISCSEENPEEPPQNGNGVGRLVINSTPSGARIYLQGTDTGKNTPGIIDNLEPGTYDGFLYLQYFDTSYFTAEIFENLTTTKNITLDDIFLEFQWDYILRYTGDSVKFSYLINQDVLLDSIVVNRPLNDTSNVIEKYYYNQKLLISEDQFGNPITYYLPPEEDGREFYPRIEDKTYLIYVHGHKAHGSQSNFNIFYSQEL